MRITPTAVEAILGVMQSRGLDNREWSFGISVEDNGVVVIGFNQERSNLSFGDLGVIVSENIDTEGLLIDFAVIDGRRGLIFSAEETTT